MAPVAGGVTDTQKNGLILGSRSFHGFWTPGIPVNWIMGMLEKIGAGFGNQPVGEFVSAQNDTPNEIILGLHNTEGMGGNRIQNSGEGEGNKIIS